MRVRKRRAVTRVVKRPEKWEGEKEYRRLAAAANAAMEGEWEVRDFELGDGWREGEGLSDDESGVETEEEVEEYYWEEEEVMEKKDDEDDEGGEGVKEAKQGVAMLTVKSVLAASPRICEILYPA